MDQQIKAAWLKALRSGKYKQGSEYLFNNGEYCCLGVLAKVIGAKFDKDGIPIFKGKRVGAQNSSDSLLSPTFCGLRTSTQQTLASMNDGIPESKSFREIADYIERRLQGRQT